MNCLIDLKEMSLLASEIIRVVVDPYSAGENIGMISSVSKVSFRPTKKKTKNTRSFKNHHILPEFESSPQLLLSATYLVRYLNHEITDPEGSFLYYEQIHSISSKQ